MEKNKPLAPAYINLIYGYDLDKVNVSLNDIAMFLSFLDTLQSKAKDVNVNGRRNKKNVQKNR